MVLDSVAHNILNALVEIDRSREAFKSFHPGVGPYGEPQLLKKIAEYLNGKKICQSQVITKRTPDMLIPGEWALEFKIARPFGDNGKEAENWSVNLLHPYRGNVSLIGDCFKLLERGGRERRAVITIGYEHNPPVIDLTPLIESFEVVARNVLRLNPSGIKEQRANDLIHPVHQVVRVFAWEVIGNSP